MDLAAIASSEKGVTEECCQRNYSTLVIKRVCIVALSAFALYLNLTWFTCGLPLGALIALVTDFKGLHQTCELSSCSTLLLVDLSGTRFHPLALLAFNIAIFVSHAFHHPAFYPLMTGAWAGGMLYRKLRFRV